MCAGYLGEGNHMLRGTLDDFDLSEVLRLLASSKKTGVLELVRPAGTGTIFFSEGQVTYAETELAASLLGQKLARSGTITENQLRAALDEQSRSGERLGRILLEAGVVSTQDIQGAMSSQVADASYELLCWDTGEFTWQPHAGLPDEGTSLSVEDLITDAARRKEEVQLVSEAIPSSDTVLKMATDPPQGAGEINITPNEWRVLVLVDGRRTVSDIAAAAELDEYDAMRVLYGLATAGLIGIDERAARDAVQTAPATTSPAPSAFSSGAGPEVDVPGEWFDDPDRVAPASQASTEPAPAPAQAPALPTVDRASVVRELSGLFQEPRPRPDPPEGPPVDPPKETESGPDNGRGRLARFVRRAGD